MAKKLIFPTWSSDEFHLSSSQLPAARSPLPPEPLPQHILADMAEPVRQIAVSFYNEE